MRRSCFILLLAAGFVLPVTCPGLLHAQSLSAEFGAGPARLTKVATSASYYKTGLSVAGALLYSVRSHLHLMARSSYTRYAVDNGAVNDRIDFGTEGEGGSWAFLSLSVGGRVTTPSFGAVNGFTAVTTGLYRNQWRPPRTEIPPRAKVDAYGPHGWWDLGLHIETGLQVRLSSESTFVLSPSFTRIFNWFPGRGTLGGAPHYLSLHGGVQFDL